MDIPKVGILVGPRGRGSNMAAISRSGLAEVAVVISPTETAPAVQVARDLGLTVTVVPTGDEYGSRLVTALGDLDFVCLAGYMRLLPVEVLRRFDGRVLNIHPSLLPKYGGKGMYGSRVHEAVLAAGDAVSGCTVHYVNEKYDEGSPLLQLQCPVLPGDTPETLAARVLALEHQAYPWAIEQAAALANRPSVSSP
jgi:phosphoribosylglycinamide formyltransferase-1